MGWAKYMEDNSDIITERQSQRAEEDHREPLKRAIVTGNDRVPIPTGKTSSPDQGSHNDRHLICQDCGRPFTFSVKDQLFYEKNGWNPPKRCKSCRELRKTRRLGNAVN